VVSEQQMGESASAAYEEALALSVTALGTVCVVVTHYLRQGRSTPRHIEPYRMGYHHGNPDHWHASERDYLQCGS